MCFTEYIHFWPSTELLSKKGPENNSLWQLMLSSVLPMVLANSRQQEKDAHHLTDENIATHSTDRYYFISIKASIFILGALAFANHTLPGV